MKKNPKRLAPLLVILSLVLSWAMLLYIHRMQQQVIITTNQPMLQTVANLLARSVEESLSLKLDYNRERMHDVYLQESLVMILTPVDGFDTSTAWITANQMVHFGLNENQVLAVENLTLPDFLAAVQNQTAGSAVYSWQAGDPQTLNAWAPVSIQGYEWLVGISISVEELKAMHTWPVLFNQMVGLLAGVSVLFVALLMWDHTR